MAVALLEISMLVLWLKRRVDFHDVDITVSEEYTASTFILGGSIFLRNSPHGVTTQKTNMAGLYLFSGRCIVRIMADYFFFFFLRLHDVTPVIIIFPS